MVRPREQRRHDVTAKTLDHIVSRTRMQKFMHHGLGSLTHLWHKFRQERSSQEEGENDDHINRMIRKLQSRYEDASVEEQDELRHQIFALTDNLPNYSPLVTKPVYQALKWKGKNTLFDKVHLSGHYERAMELAQQGGLVTIPTHNDMQDVLFTAYPFLEHGMRPPVYLMGDNLKSGMNSYLLPRFNGMFIKRDENYTPLEHLVQVEEIETLLKVGENMAIYAEGTRSRDGKIAPLKQKKRYVQGEEKTFAPMRKAFLGPVLWANRRMERDLHYTVLTVSSPLFNDVLEEYAGDDEGRGSRLSTMQRLTSFSNFSHVSGESGIHLHFSEPTRIGKGQSSLYNKLNLRRYTSAIRNEMKRNITVLPENIMAYAMHQLHLRDEQYQHEGPRSREKHLRDTFMQHVNYISKRKVNRAPVIDKDPEQAFNIATDFYRGLGILGDDYTLDWHFLIEYNSNRVQHFFKDKMPLPPG